MNNKSFAILATTALVAISTSAAAEQRHSSNSYDGYRSTAVQNNARNYNNYQSASGAAVVGNKYEPRVEIGGKIGNERNIGAVKMMAPLYQTNNSMVFTDIRGRMDDNSSEEYNIGLGYRQVTKLGDADVIVGGYGFYDHLSSELGNDYSQVTVGLEAMTEKWDVRVNGYFPDDDENATGAGTIELTGGSIGIRGGLETALPGFDAEVGYKLPINKADVRVYAGGYHFSKDGFETVAGPSGRVEMTVDERQLNFLPSGSEVTLGLEAQYDDVREDQYFALAEFRMPLSFSGNPSNYKNLSAIDRRMTKFVERDVDIVTSGGQQNTVEDAVINGSTHSSFIVVDANDNISTEVANADSDALIILDGSAGTINTATAVALANGQSVISGGQTITATGATTGITASRKLTGAAAIINGTDAGVNVIETASNNNITAISITGGLDGIRNDGDDNVRITNVNISNTADDGIHSNNSSNLTITGGTINNVADNGVDINTGTSIAISGLTINTPGVDGIYIVNEADGIAINNTTINGAVRFGFRHEAVTGDIDNVSGSGNIVTNAGGGDCSSSPGGNNINSTLAYNGDSICN